MIDESVLHMDAFTPLHHDLSIDKYSSYGTNEIDPFKGIAVNNFTFACRSVQNCVLAK